MHPRNGRDFQLLDLPARFTNTMDVERELDGILNCIRPEACCNGGYDGKDIAIGCEEPETDDRSGKSRA